MYVNVILHVNHTWTSMSYKPHITHTLIPGRTALWLTAASWGQNFNVDRHLPVSSEELWLRLHLLIRPEHVNNFQMQIFLFHLISPFYQINRFALGREFLVSPPTLWAPPQVNGIMGEINSDLGSCSFKLVRWDTKSLHTAGSTEDKSSHRRRVGNNKIDRSFQKHPTLLSQSTTVYVNVFLNRPTQNGSSFWCGGTSSRFEKCSVKSSGSNGLQKSHD